MSSSSNLVYVLRTCAADLTAYNGFQWPSSGPVTAPDWKPTPECDNGLHGLLWGRGDASYLSCNADAKWLVVAVPKDSIIDLNGKVKFPAGEVVYCGDRFGATSFIIARGANPANCAYATVTVGDNQHAAVGDRGTASAGEYGTASAGEYGTASAGEDGTASAGDFGTASTGDFGTASAGYRGTASVGEYGTASAGEDGTASAGDGGTIIIIYFDYSAKRYRRAIGYVGEAGIKANVRYCVVDGQLQEVR